jgi:DNA-binding CsgD family transcriptional regulator
METFSRMLAQLYEVAESTPPNQFRSKILHLLMPLIRFDGAILRTGEIETAYCGAFHYSEMHANVMGGPEPRDHAENLQEDALHSALAGSPHRPLCFDRNHLHTKFSLLHLAAFARIENMDSLMLYGDSNTSPKTWSWLALYRGAGSGFVECEAELMLMAWPHVAQAIKMNLKQALNNMDPNRMKRSLALINSRGLIEFMDQAMIELLKLEWPNFADSRLPDHVIKKLVATGSYRGNRIELSTGYRSGYMVCSAARISIIYALAPSELRVAQGFAGGLTYSKIATQLGVSPNTVRNQLAHVYQKLGVHGKAELVQLLSHSTSLNA